MENPLVSLLVAVQGHLGLVCSALQPATFLLQGQSRIIMAPLSTTESEYVGLSESLRIAIVLMNLLKEMKEHGVELPTTKPTIAKSPKMRPRTRHINQKYHHFREWVKSGLIDILAIDTEEQPADLLTKPLSVATFVKHRKRVMGW
jgi:hypothetical protein